MTIEEVVEIIPGGKKNVIMDSQILTSLMTCPRLADFRFNHHFIPIGGKSNSLECGSIVHTFLEHFYKSIIAGTTREQAIQFGFTAAELYIRGCVFCSDFVPTDCPTCQGTGRLERESSDEVFDVVPCEVCKGLGKLTKPACGHRANDFPGVHNTPKESEGYKTGWQYVLDTCQQYVDFWKNDHWVPLEIEIVKGVVLYEDEEIRVMWKAKLDGVFDTNQAILPMDHKTMKQNRKTNSMNNQFMGQCLIMKSRNVIINKIGFQKTLAPAEKFIRSPISYTAERLLEWQSETLPFYAKLLLMYAETGHFPPNFTSCEGKYGDCNFYEHVCSDNPSMREENLKLHFMVGPEWNPTNEDED